MTAMGSPRPFVVPVFIPHTGCPHRCLFCDQHTIAGRQPPPDTGTILARIRDFLDYRGPDRPFTEIAFYGGNFLGLPEADLLPLLDVATAFVRAGAADGIRFSTRPDTVTDQTLARIADYPVTTVEIGAQSMDDTVLRRSARGHGATDTRRAVMRLQNTGVAVGIQLMLGLPGDTPDRADASAAQIRALKPDLVRIYPTVVLRGTGLAKLYRAGAYRPWHLETAVKVAARMFCGFRRNGIRVARMGLHADGGLDNGAILAGPFHPAFGECVWNHLFYQTACRAFASRPGSHARTAGIRVHPRSVSRMRGIQNENVRRLVAEFNLSEITVAVDAALGVDQLAVDPLPPISVCSDIDT
jgi:histone acetyltransferase (RNA polymerase elongator complex component)